jgi:hypothetical protein
MYMFIIGGSMECEKVSIEMHSLNDSFSSGLLNVMVNTKDSSVLVRLFFRIFIMDSLRLPLQANFISL